ncbi:hypothetical protein ACA910_017376 [Epithemia clementina (nom. ined.)]
MPEADSAPITVDEAKGCAAAAVEEEPDQEESRDNDNNSPVNELRATPLMCFHCFETLVQNLRLSFPQQLSNQLGGVVPVTMQHNNNNNNSNQPPLFWNDLPHESIQCPLFVTWEKQRRPPPTNRFFSNLHKKDVVSTLGGGGGVLAPPQSQSQSPAVSYELRGCIGTLSPMPVATALTKYTLMSALRDQRFVPIHPSEIPTLRVAVSLLVQYEECQHVYDWQIGVHGIVIKFSTATASQQQPQQGYNNSSNNKNNNNNAAEYYSATYLPEVALEQGWDQVAAVASLIRKAGYTHDITQSLLQSIQCTRYQSSKLKMNFEEYVHIQRSIIQQQQQQYGYSNGGDSGGNNTNNQASAAEPIMNYAYKPAAGGGNHHPYHHHHHNHHSQYSYRHHDNPHCNIL